MALRWGRRARDVAALDAELARAEAERAEGRTARALRAYRRVIADAATLREQDENGSTARHAAALVGVGDLLATAGDPAGALANYREATGTGNVPPYVLRVLAEDSANRQDITPAGIDEVAAHLGGEPPSEWSPPVVTFAQQVCFPPQGSGPEAVTLAEALATRIAAATPSTEWAHRARGFALTATGRPEEAVVALAEAERLAPKDASIPYWLGVLHHQAGDVDAAHSAFGRSLDRDPDQPDVLRWGARTALDQTDRGDGSPGLIAEAIERLERAARLQPERAETWFELAGASRRRDPAAARAAAVTAVRLAPKVPEHHLQLADLVIEIDGPAEAVTVLESALTHLDSDPEIDRRLGGVLLDLGRHAEALTHLLAAEVAPGDRELTRNVARCHLALDRPALVVSALEAVRDPSNEEVELLARARAARGDINAALEDISRRRVRGKLVPRLAFVRGVLLAQQEAWQEALVAFEEARAGDGQPADLDLYVAVTYLRLGELDRAARLVDGAGVRENDPRLHHTRGALAADRDDWAAAHAAFSRALELDPHHHESRVGDAAALERLGRFVEAYDLYRAAIEDRPDDLWLRTRAVATSLLAGRPDPDVGAVPEKEQPPPRLTCLRALAAARRGDMSTARAWWASLPPSEDPDGVAADDAAAAADHLAWAELVAGRPALARRLWEEARIAAPDDHRLQASLVEATVRVVAAAVGPDIRPHPLRVALRPALDLAPEEDRVRALAGLLALLDEDGEAAARLLHDGHDGFHQALAAAMTGNRSAVDVPATRGVVVAALVRGTAFAHAGRWAEALDAYGAGLDAAAPRTLLDAITRCAVEAGDPGAGVLLLNRIVDDSPAARVRSALLSAEAGDLAGARSILGVEAAVATADPDEQAGLRTALARLYLREAGRALAQRDPARAVPALEDAAAMQPTGPARTWAEEALRLVRDSADERPALQRWEDKLLADPADLLAAHHVAVLVLPWVTGRPTDRPGPVPPATRTPLPHLLVACWAMVLYSPAFWQDLGRRSGRDIDPAARDRVRDELSDEIVRALRDRATGEETAPDAAEVELDWGVELRAARAVTSLVAQHDVGRWPPGIAVGPRLLALIEATGEDGRARAAALQAAAAEHSPGTGLATLLCLPTARARHLIDERRGQDALRLLGDLPASETVKGLQAEAWLVTALTHCEISRWKPAVEAFAEARRTGTELGQFADKVRTAATRAADALRKDDDLKGATEILNTGRGLVAQDEKYDTNMAAVLSEYGLQLNNDRTDYAGAVTILRRAVALTPKDSSITRFGRIAMLNQAGRLLDDAARTTDARALVNEAVALEPDGAARVEARRNAAKAVRNAAVGHVNDDRFDHGIELITWALELDDDADTRTTAAQAYKIRGNVRAGRGDRAGAIRDLRSAHRLDPSDPQVAALVRRLG